MPHIAKCITKETLKSGSIDIVYLYGQTSLVDIISFFQCCILDYVDGDYCVMTDKAPCFVLEVDVSNGGRLQLQELCQIIDVVLLAMVPVKICINFMVNVFGLKDETTVNHLNCFDIDKHLVKAKYTNIKPKRNINVCFPIKVPQIVFVKQQTECAKRHKYQFKVANVMLKNEENEQN